MAPSKAGCFHILGCAGAAREDDEAGAVGDPASAEESKALSDKSRWSFRRKSTRHRSFKNNETFEPELISSNKGNSDVMVANNFCSPQYSHCSEKTADQEKTDECVKLLPNEAVSVDKAPKFVDVKNDPREPPSESSSVPCEPVTEQSSAPIQPVAEESTLSKSVVQESTISKLLPEEKGLLVEPNVKEITTSLDQIHVDSAAIVIQSSVRMLMARQELENHRRLVKLQAAIRGHLVRRQAYNTLRCLLAIMKFQELARSYKAQILVDKQLMSVDKSSQGKLGSQTHRTVYHSSRNKLLSNAFAQKILEEGPSLRTMSTRCDLAMPDSAWRWLEAWTALVPPCTGEHLSANKEISELDGSNIMSESLSVCNVVSCDSDMEGEVEKMGSADIPNAPIYVSLEASLDCSGQQEQGNQEDYELVEVNEFVIQETESTTQNAAEESLSSLSNMKSMRSEQPSESTLSDVTGSYDIENSCKTELTDIESKKFALRKPCNPAFAAVQSKFEELSAGSFISRPASFSNWDGRSKQNQMNLRSQDEVLNKNNACDSLMENNLSISHPKNLGAASECGTEISVSSTLDSPERSENEGSEIVIEIGALENKNYSGVNTSCDTLQTRVRESDGLVIPLQKVERENEILDDLVVSDDAAPVENLSEEITKEAMDDQYEDSTDISVKMPVDGTPRSQTTVTDPCETPSSEASVSKIKGKRERSKTTHKQRPNLLAKQDLSSPKSGSVGRNSTENLQKDSKKRESSSRSTKYDNGDCEPRLSNSTPLPSYMQFTESARAKTSASVSPKLSPDVQESLPRKRLSAPLSNDKQESSPRMHRSSSHATHTSKVNGSHISADKRWQV